MSAALTRRGEADSKAWVASAERPRCTAYAFMRTITHGNPRAYVSISCECKHMSQESYDTVSNAKGTDSSLYGQKPERCKQTCNNLPFSSHRQTKISLWHTQDIWTLKWRKANNYIKMKTTERPNRMRRENPSPQSARAHHIPSKRKYLIRH